MADVRAVKSGNWSDPTVWNTGALPTSADDVWANTFTVAADTTTTVLSIRNGSTTNVTAGGGFTAVNGVTLTLTGSGVVAGSTTATVFTSSLTTGQSCALVGNLAAATGGCATNGSTGTLSITGNCTGGTSAGANAICVVNSSSGSISITGNVTGAAQSGASNTSTGILNITGTCTGGTGGVAGANNTSTGTLTHAGTVQASTTCAGIVGANAGQVTILTGPFLTSSNGINPVTCARWFWQNTTPRATYYQIRSANLSVIRPLYTADSVGGNPAISNVRSGTVYGPNSELTGTCAVPGASSVLSGVPVDNTTGTATISAADIRAAMGLASANLDTQLAAKPSATAIRTEMDSNSTKLANLDATISSRSTYAGADTSGTTTLLSRLTSTRAGYLDNISAAPPSAADIATAVWAAGTRTLTTTIASASDIASAVWSAVTRTLTSNAAPSAADVATAVRSELGSELGRIDASVSSRLAGSSYSAPPSAATNASAVRTELAPELGNLDATVSSRLASSSYTSPPSAASIATAVWSAATRTLTTAIDNSATIAAAVWSYATGRTITGGTVDTLVNSPSVPSAAAIASQVRTELATELARLDAAISTRLATSGYTTPPTAAAITSAVWAAADKTGYSLTSAERTAIATAVEQSILNENDGQAILNAIVGAIGTSNVDQVALVAAIRTDLERAGGTLATRLAASAYTTPPTAAQNASAVRTELSTELARIDATVSSRLAPNGTLARVTLTDTTTTLTNAPDVPTGPEIAEAVREELAPELARVANCSTVETTGAQIAALE